MSNTKRSKRGLDRALQDAYIEIKSPTAVADAVSFLKAELGNAADSIVVVEEADRVLTIPLAELSVSEKSLHLHGFSSSARAQARVAKTTTGWIGDAVCEREEATPEARKVVAQGGRVMCLGERVADTGTFAEARIKPYQLPVRGDARQIDVTYRDYYEETASGRLTCIAHRAIGFIAREGK